MRYIIGTLIVLGFIFNVSAQFTPHEKPTAGKVLHDIQKLNKLGSVLYIAAHPDDENTRFIAYQANGEQVDAAYLSLTRGDGGQNMIGTEIGPYLGLIRTQELLAARRTDGGKQFFTRAYDFGYSKTPKETRQIWDDEQVLADMVWVIRNYRPDVMVTRFAPKKYGYKTHGHHSTSAELAEEAFVAAGDKTRFPEQLIYVEPWQPKRLYWNTSTWFYRRSGAKFDPTDKLSVDVGQFDKLLGESYSEISSESRTQHKSQGFGSGKNRGSQMEWLEYVMGEQADSSLWENIDNSWNRVSNSTKVAYHLNQAERTYDANNPATVLPHLISAKREIVKALKSDLSKEDAHWLTRKQTDLDDVIAEVCGLFFEVTASDFAYVAGDTMDITISAVNRCDAPVQLNYVEFPATASRVRCDSMLSDNESYRIKDRIVLDDSLPITRQYWLANGAPEGGMFKVTDQTLIGKAESDPAIEAIFVFDVLGTKVGYKTGMYHKRTDRVKGEIYRPVMIAPQVTVTADQTAYLTTGGDPKEILLTVKSWRENVAGTLETVLPSGWLVEPDSIGFDLAEKGGEQVIKLMVTPPNKDAKANLVLKAIIDDESFASAYVNIDYDHMPNQTDFPSSTILMNNINMKAKGPNLGYIMGAGDKVAENLQLIGYNVTMIDADNFNQINLSDFDAILVGIRAYNTEEWLVQKHTPLMQYVEDGGNLIVQYQTTWGLKSSDIGPYPLTLGRDRVTLETAEMRFVKKNHPILTTPNKLGAKDFENWVQERGLYFASEWDDKYQPIFEANDPDEKPSQGSLLVADYGKGSFMYTGISFFRELPAGVSGAYRLLANMIAYGK